MGFVFQSYNLVPTLTALENVSLAGEYAGVSRAQARIAAMEARAFRCALAITSAVAEIGLEIRAGVHTGEVDLRGSDVGGLTVHIAARVAAMAGAGEVLVSSTVKDLLVGAGIEFDSRGKHELKGVPDVWRLYAAKDR